MELHIDGRLFRNFDSKDAMPFFDFKLMLNTMILIKAIDRYFSSFVMFWFKALNTSYSILINIQNIKPKRMNKLAKMHSINYFWTIKLFHDLTVIEKYWIGDRGDSKTKHIGQFFNFIIADFLFLLSRNNSRHIISTLLHLTT